MVTSARAECCVGVAVEAATAVVEERAEGQGGETQRQRRRRFVPVIVVG